MNRETLKLLNMMAQYHTTDVSDATLQMYASDLRDMTTEEIRLAWEAYRQNNNAMPKPKDIRDHVQDGRPSVNEAWAMIPRDEDSSVIWSEEMREAYGVAAPLIANRELSNAFFAFKEAYERAIKRNRVQGVKPKWSPSFGHDYSGRETALKEAIIKNRISLDFARRFVPEIEAPAAQNVLQAGKSEALIKQLAQKKSLE